MSDYIISLVPITMIEYLWDDILPNMERVIQKSHGEITCDSIKTRLFKGEMLLICVLQGNDMVAISVVEVRTFETGKRVLCIPVMGGDKLDEWLDQYLDVLEAIGKDYNCTEVRAIGARAGWAKKLKQFGWGEISIAVGKQI